ncbi:MAG TPA: dipeptidase [Pyrinomonadaceae bacterium]|nr:dipeptidase [Pyrinomonadaceae bacterium]
MSQQRIINGKGVKRLASRDGADRIFVLNVYAMKQRRLLLSTSTIVLVISFLASGIQSSAQRETRSPQRRPAQSSTRSPRDEALWQRALAIHRRAIVVDTHNDITTPMTNDDYDLGGNPPTPYRTSIERMKQGGLTGLFFSLYIKPWYVEHGGAARRTLDMIDSVYRAVERHPNDLMLANSAADIRRAKAQGKIACLMGIEGGHAIEDSLPTLREFYRLGVRYMTLTWNNANDWADSNREKKHNGLTDFGKDVVREMNRLGMLVDVSHVGDKTMSDVLDVSKAPIIASHSSARAISNVPRNIPDDLLKRIAKNGGVVQVNFYSLFVDQKTVAPQSDERGKRLQSQQEALSVKYANDPERLAEESDKLEAANPLPPLPISKLIDHIDHIVKVAGIDHVGLGPDFDGANDFPEGARDESMLPNITYELLKRGYSEQDIDKILGGNFLRVFAEAETTARKMSRTISGGGSTRRINK